MRCSCCRRAVRRAAWPRLFCAQARGAPFCCRASPAFGGLDEQPLAMDGALALPPAISAEWRLAVLTRLILDNGRKEWCASRG